MAGSVRGRPTGESRPTQGDVYWADPDSTRGSEQAKERPFANVSVDQLNRSALDFSLEEPLRRCRLLLR